MENPVLRFIRNLRDSEIAKTILKKKKLGNSYFAFKNHYSYRKQNCEVFISKQISRTIEQRIKSSHTLSSYFDKDLNTIQCRNTSQLKELYFEKLDILLQVN